MNRTHQDDQPSGKVWDEICEEQTRPIVTRDHRVWAIACWEEWEYGLLTPDHEAWLNVLPTEGEYHVEGLIAQAIAEAEARGAARARAK